MSGHRRSPPRATRKLFLGIVDHSDGCEACGGDFALSHLEIKGLRSPVWVCSACNPGWTADDKDEIDAKGPLVTFIGKFRSLQQAHKYAHKWARRNEALIEAGEELRFPRALMPPDGTRDYVFDVILPEIARQLVATATRPVNAQTAH